MLYELHIHIFEHISQGIILESIFLFQEILTLVDKATYRNIQLQCTCDISEFTTKRMQMWEMLSTELEATYGMYV